MSWKKGERRPDVSAAAGWTDERVLEMRGLWRDGLSAEQIAKQMGGGLTRNAVLGKIHRMGFQADRRAGVNPIAEAAVVKRDAGRRRVEKLFNARARALENVRVTSKPKAAPKPKATPDPAATVDEFGAKIEPLPDWQSVDGQGVDIFDLQPHHCRWPAWQHGLKSGLFCGNRRVEPLSYCIGHARIAYRPADSRERRLSTYLPRNQGA